MYGTPQCSLFVVAVRCTSCSCILARTVGSELRRCITTIAQRTIYRKQNSGKQANKLSANNCRINVRQHYSAERVVSVWNSLSPSVVDFSSLSAFRRTIHNAR